MSRATFIQLSIALLTLVMPEIWRDVFEFLRQSPYWRFVQAVCVIWIAVVLILALPQNVLSYSLRHRTSTAVLLGLLAGAFVAGGFLKFAPRDKNNSSARQWQEAFDRLDTREAYTTRTFELSRDKGQTISLGPCPGEKCLEIGLGELVNTQEGLEQEIIIRGDIGVKFTPEPGLLFHMNAMIEGARLVPGAEHSSAWFILRQGGGFSLRTHRADIIFTVVDLQADNLKIKLEIKPSSLTERRKDRNRQGAAQGLTGLQLRTECDKWIESGKTLYQRLCEKGWQQEAIKDARNWLKEFERFAELNFSSPISDYDRLTYFRKWTEPETFDVVQMARHYQRSVSYCYGQLSILRSKIT